MSSAAPAPSLSFASLNVNGLNGTSKRRAFFHAWQRRTDRIDVLLLQETHCASQEVERRWVEGGAGPGLPCSGPAAWAHGSAASRGVALLVHPTLSVERFHIVHQDPRGRVVGALLTVGGHSYLVYSVYAPHTANDRASFFTSTLRPILLEGVGQHPDAFLVVGGDFNCIESPTLDQRGAASSTHRLQGFADGLLPVQQELGLVDAYRTLFPNGTAFTHLATDRSSSARLDRLLFADSLSPYLLQADVRDGWPGDHRLAYAALTQPDSLPRGPGDWSFPPHLAADPDFVALMRTRFIAWFQQHPVSPQLSAGDRWERFKRFARDRTQAYCILQQQRRREQRQRQVQRAASASARYAANPSSPPVAAAWAAAQQALQREREADAARAALLAGVAWEAWGETSTAWFHRVAQERRAASTIAELEVPAAGGGQPRVVSLATEGGRAAASECIARFYDGAHRGGLFFPRHTDPAAQSELLGVVDRLLSSADRAACEGPLGEEGLAAAELGDALKHAAKGKMPGSDGLTYEFYSLFWDVVGEPLAEVFSCALAQGGSLTESQRLGVVVLLYKGAKAGSRALVKNYRPITLLNCDYKLLALALARRFSCPLASIIDPTQTAFLPGRWIGDNILMHLEEIDYLEETQQPGVIAFVDFEKAYDVTSRPWVTSCMRALGFGPVAIGWVMLLLRDTRARCRFNGWHTRDFMVCSGVAQGSPLSPVLYVIAAQPLAARMRQLQRQGVIRSITLPDGTPAPPSHQHADDTSLHLARLSDLQVAFDRALQPWCAASGSRAHPDKTKVMLLGSEAAAWPSNGFIHAGTGALVSPRSEAVRHLGIMLGAGQVGEVARAAKFTAMHAVVLRRIQHWSAQALTHDGRAHVARQCLASTLVFHATFTRPPRATLNALHSSVVRFVQGVDAVGGPCVHVAHLPRALGGRGVPSVRRIVDSLQAGIVVRLLHPERLPWKLLLQQRFAILTPPSSGLRSLFSAGGPTGLPPRVGGYWEGFRACGPHRLTPPADLPAPHILLEPLFDNPTLLDDGGLPLTPSAFPLSVAGGVHTVGDLSTVLHQQPPVPAPLSREARALSALLPLSWRALAGAPASAQAVHPWQDWPAASSGCSMEAVHVASGGPLATAYSVGPTGALLCPRQVPWPPPPSRPAGGPCLVVDAAAGAQHDVVVVGGSLPSADAEPADRQRSPRLYRVGPWGGGPAAALDASAWGLAAVPLLRSTVRLRTAALVQRDLAVTVAAGGAASAGGFVPGLAVRPAVWPPEEGSDNGVGGDSIGGSSSSLEARERRWAAAVTPAPGRVRRPCAVTQAADAHLMASAAWFRVSPPGRAHPLQRALERSELCTDTPPGPAAGQRRRGLHRPSALLAPFDPPPTGGAPPSGALPWAGAWQALHRVPAPRQHRFLAWRVMHASLPVAARTASWGGVGAGAPGLRPGVCHRPGCAVTHSPETLSHVFLDCPIAQTVIAWVCDLWVAVSARAPPPRTAAVFFAADRRVFDPGGLSQFWHVLRLAALYFLWSGRCVGREQSRAVTPISVVAQLVQYLRTRIRADALAASSHRRVYSVIGAVQLIPDRPPLDFDVFLARWAYRDVLCSCPAVGGVLVVHLSLGHPVPPPAPSP